MLLRFHSLGGATEAFPRSRQDQSSDRDQRGQGCAAPVGLDLDASARRGRTVAGGERCWPEEFGRELINMQLDGLQCPLLLQ
jgi:hypothetical protein